LHDQDIVNIFDTLSTKANLSDIEELSLRIQNLEEVVNAYQNSDTSDRISLLEEYANMIYDTLNTKASFEDVEQMIVPLKEEMNNISSALRSITTKVNSQDIDIIKLYNSIAQLSEELQRLAGRLSLIETIVRELYQKSGK
jgi:chromosome segregation ATPase